MRLILEYENSDGYTFSCTNTIPVVYESAEKFLVDLMDLALKAIEAKGDGEFKIAGHTFSGAHFYHYVNAEDLDHRHLKYVMISSDHYLPVNPSVYTVDEWFVQAEKNQ